MCLPPSEESSSCSERQSRILEDDEKPSSVEGNIGYAYVGRDLVMQSLETSKACDNIKTKKYTSTDIYEIRTNGGYICPDFTFRRIVTEKVFPFYYTMLQIEQGFDVCKNNTKMLPFRTQT